MITEPMLAAALEAYDKTAAQSASFDSWMIAALAAALAKQQPVRVKLPQSHSLMNLMGHADSPKSPRYIVVDDVLAMLKSAGIEVME